MRWLPAIIIGVSILLAPLVWHLSRLLLTSEDPGVATSAVDSGARIDIELMRGEIELLRLEIETLRREIAALESRLDAALGGGTPGGEFDTPLGNRENDIIDDYAQVVLIANRLEVNGELTVPSPRFIADMLGRPREQLSDECESMTNQRLSEMLYVGDVGPIQVRLLEPAVQSMRQVFERVRQVDEDLYDRINTSGSLCVRRIRGSIDSISSHAFGLAVDLNIDGTLDLFADGRTQIGLIILADFFREEGWIWGAGFSREDSMHFEVSREMLERWRAEGRI